MNATSIDLRLSDFPDALAVLKLRAKEPLSECPYFDVVVNVPGDSSPPALLGQDAQISFDQTETARRVAGWVTRARVGPPLANGSRAAHLRVEPHWSALRHRRNSRIFQDATTIQIATQIASEHGVTLVGGTRAETPVRGYCVQHQETDLAFLERLFADEGLVYLFADPEGTATRQAVVVIDHAARYVPLRGDERLELRTVDTRSGGSAMQLDEHHVTRFEPAMRASSTASHTREFDLKRPGTLLARSQPTARDGHATWYEHHSAYGEAQLEAEPGRLLEQVQRDQRLSSGRSVCRRLAPGRTFELDGDDPAVAGRYAITHVRHRADASDTGGLSYETRFNVVPSEVLYRPARPAPRLHQILETATVVGPAREAIHTDELGRIKVQFHWDLDGANDDRSSCWIRVSQSWAGAGWGSQFIPRVGMEVIVGFLGGDVDRPMVLGCVENATHMAPFPLPASKTRSGIRTDSVGAEGFNELSFEDAAGREQVLVRAQKDLVVHALHDSRTTIDNDSSLLVSANRTEEIRGTHTTRSIGEATYWYESDASFNHHRSAATTVGEDLRTNVGGSIHSRVAGTSTSIVDDSRADRVERDFSIHAGSSYTLQVGRTGDDENPGELTVRSTGITSVASDKRTIVSAEEGLTLACGDSRIELTPHQIVLSSPRVVLVGTESLVAAGKGPALQLTDKATIVSDELRILTKSGSLELADETILKGKAIKFEKGTPKPNDDRSDDPPETRRVRIQLTDYLFRPYASCRFESRAAQMRQEGTTDGDGFLELVVPKTAKRAALTYWTGPYPTGARKERVVVINELPAIDLLAGVQTRLRNLGYYEGGTAGEILDDITRAAIRHFQLDHDLPPTGELDEPTLRALDERAGR